MMFSGLVPAQPFLPSQADILGYDLLVEQTGLEPGPWKARHLQPFGPLPPLEPGGQPRPFYTIRRRPGLTVGTWTGSMGSVEFTREYLKQIVESFPYVVRDLRPWVTINHAPIVRLPDLLGVPQHPETEPHPRALSGIGAVMGSPSDCYFLDTPFVTSDGRVFEPGEIIMVDLVNVPGQLARSIQRRNYQRISFGIEDDFVDTSGRVWPRCLQHVSCEGAQPEACYSLEDLDRVFYMSRGVAAGEKQTVEEVLLGAFKQELNSMATENAAPPVAPPDAAPPVDLAGVDPKLVSILESMAQGIDQIRQAVVSVVARVDAIEKVEAETEPAADMAKAEELAKEGAVAPPAAVAPAAAESPAVVQLSRQVVDLTSRLETLAKAQNKTLELSRRDNALAFAKKHVAPAKVVLAVETLVHVEEQEQAGKVQEFARGDGSASKINLSGAIRELLQGAGRTISNTLKDLKAPAASGISEPDRWNKHTTHAAVHEYCRANKLDAKKDIPKAVAALAAEYGREFQLGMTRE